MMKVEQMINDRGNGAMNQFVLRDGNKIVFQSYDSTIAEVDHEAKTIVLGKHWDYSVTTNKHRNIFFRDYVYMPQLATKKALQNAINDGRFGGYTIKLAS